MNKNITYDLMDILAITKKIKSEAEEMTQEELDALGAGDGWMAFIDQEPDFALWLTTLPQEEAQSIIDIIMTQVSNIYMSKITTHHTEEELLLLDRLGIAANKLTKEQIEQLVNIAENPDIWLNKEIN